MRGAFDYGPLGAQLKRNLVSAWWSDFVVKRRDCVGFDSPVILHPQVWRTAGHEAEFTDPLIQCGKCNARVRADTLMDAPPPGLTEASERAWLDKLDAHVSDNEIKCPECGAHEWDKARAFNLLFTTQFRQVTGSSDTEAAGDNVSAKSSGKKKKKSGASASAGAAGGGGGGGGGDLQSQHNRAYLRPETAQGVYVAFPFIHMSTNFSFPIGIAQVGRSFRNEISPSNFLFRTREFEQMELQYFCAPEQSDEKYEFWVDFCQQWLESLGLRQDLVRKDVITGSGLAHYARAATDFEFQFPFGWGELLGVAHRGDYDLKLHAASSGQPLLRSSNNPDERVTPHVIEPAIGVDRLFYAVLCSAFREEVVPGNNESRVVLQLHPRLAPFTCAVLPLKKNLAPLAEELCDALMGATPAGLSVSYATQKSLGRRYRREDQVGTPLCITVDFRTDEDRTVTVRHRDTMLQLRVPIAALVELSCQWPGSSLARMWEQLEAISVEL